MFPEKALSPSWDCWSQIRGPGNPRSLDSAGCQVADCPSSQSFCLEIISVHFDGSLLRQEELWSGVCRHGCHAVAVHCLGAKSCLTLCDPMNGSTPGFPVLLCPGSCSNSCALSQRCHPTISSSVAPFSSCPQSFLISGSFPVNQLLESGGLSTGASASASVLPMNIQGGFPL